MEIRVVIFVVAVFVAACAALPANKKDDVELVEPVGTYGDQPIVDTGLFSGWENPLGNSPFLGLFDNIEEIMEQMRRNVASLINKFPTISGSNSTAALPFPGFNGDGFPDIDLSKGNTTSVTKVVDGHKVVINETEYKNEDKFGGTFFKVRIIDVKPDSAEITTARDTEDIVDSRENEISKSKEAPPFQEQFDIDNDVTYRTQAVPTKWSDVVPLTQLEDNKLEAGVERIIPIDMSRDTYVNEIMRQRGAPLNPDAEIFEVDNYGKRIGPFD